MKTFANIIGTLSFIAALYFFLAIARPYSWIIAALFFGFGIFAMVRLDEGHHIVKLKGLRWTRQDFCRGWLITGDTGSGKTRSGVTQLLFQIFKNEPLWGGLCVDDKGVYWETLKEMAVHFGRQNDLILLQVRPEGAPDDWKPTHTYNLVSDRKIPFSTYAKFIVDTATSLGQQGDKAFFKNQAQTHIALALEALHEGGWHVTLDDAHEILLDDAEMDDVLCHLAGDEFTITDRQMALINHFMNRFRDQPPEQLGGVKETIGNYLHYFLTPEISEIFCAFENTFNFSDIDAGKIICVAMPQKFQTERRYINTFLKMLFYTHVLRRFDKPKEERANDNLLVLWADEAQRFVTASEDGMSDYNSVDVLREANATLVAAAQSSTSFIPPLGEAKSKVLTLNLRNRMIFKAADEDGAVESANFLGQQQVTKRSWGYSSGLRNRNYHKQDEHKIKPYELRNLQKHQCVLVHCERGFEKTTLPPIEPDGKISEWFPWWRRIL
ncbi:MAG: type IV secretory system conjugative DNA transfer family protein [Limisphaerales bacterium]